MAHWLMKSEPDTFGIDDLSRLPKKTDSWDGIRNYQVRNMIRDDMKKGDLVFFYHSNCKPPGIVGIMKITQTAYPDHTAFDPEQKYYDPKSNRDNPRWFMVDVQLVRKFKRLISLDELRQEIVLEDSALLRRGNRLSIVPLTEKQWNHILNME